MNKKIVSFVFAFVAFILEILPFGAVCNFATPEGETIRKTYSYFSLVPYGYANFFPLMTAILTVILLPFLLFSLVTKSEKAENTAFFVSFAGTILSFCPLFYGIRNFSLMGLGISICLLFSALFLWKKERLS
jgi:hypothetical protein